MTDVEKGKLNLPKTPALCKHLTLVALVASSAIVCTNTRRAFWYVSNTEIINNSNLQLLFFWFTHTVCLGSCISDYYQTDHDSCDFSNKPQLHMMSANNQTIQDKYLPNWMFLGLLIEWLIVIFISVYRVQKIQFIYFLIFPLVFNVQIFQICHMSILAEKLSIVFAKAKEIY